MPTAFHNYVRRLNLVEGMAHLLHLDAAEGHGLRLGSSTSQSRTKGAASFRACQHVSQQAGSLLRAGLLGRPFDSKMPNALHNRCVQGQLAECVFWVKSSYVPWSLPTSSSLKPSSLTENQQCLQQTPSISLGKGSGQYFFGLKKKKV